METHAELTDLEFEAKFNDCSLDPHLFNHEAHLRLAWIHIKKYGPNTAIANICTQIKRFDATHGDGTKFHTTLTIASLKIVYHFFLKSKSNTFQGFIEEFPRVKTNFRDLITSHYGINVFASSEAKKIICKTRFDTFRLTE